MKQAPDQRETGTRGRHSKPMTTSFSIWPGSEHVPDQLLALMTSSTYNNDIKSTSRGSLQCSRYRAKKSAAPSSMRPAAGTLFVGSGLPALGHTECGAVEHHCRGLRKEAQQAGKHKNSSWKGTEQSARQPCFDAGMVRFRVRIPPDSFDLVLNVAARPQRGLRS